MEVKVLSDEESQTLMGKYSNTEYFGRNKSHHIRAHFLVHFLYDKNHAHKDISRKIVLSVIVVVSFSVLAMEFYFFTSNRVLE